MARTAGCAAGRGFEDAVVVHEAHQGIDVVTIPRVAESGERGFGDCGFRLVQSDLLGR
jgi:hypothetical protein